MQRCDVLATADDVRDLGEIYLEVKIVRGSSTSYLAHDAFAVEAYHPPACCSELWTLAFCYCVDTTADWTRRCECLW